MKIFVDTASLAEIEEWDAHPWVSGFTTNPTLMRGSLKRPPGYSSMDGPEVVTAMSWAKEVVRLTDKPVSIDGPPEVWELGPNVWRKVTESGGSHVPMQNLTAICHVGQVKDVLLHPSCIVSVFAGRIMDTGRDPMEVIAEAKRTCASVLWASVREPYNLAMAEDAGCDIVTCPPAILRKYLEWKDMPLEEVAERTIAQFEKDSEGLWG